jgi:hypothetical protein
MPLVEHSLYVQVLYPDNSWAPFTRLRIDTEFKNQAGQTVVSPIAQIEDDDRKFPFLIQYKLKNPDAVLWLVLVDGDKEERQKVSVNKHRYTFPNSAETQEGEYRGQPKIVNVNHFWKEVQMSQYNISGGNQGAVGDDARAKQFTQNDNRQVGLTAEDLSALTKELPILRQALMQQAKTSEQFDALSHVKAAEEAAEKNDGQGVLNRLKSAGSWVLEVAKSIGTEVVAKVIAHQIGIG